MKMNISDIENNKNDFLNHEQICCLKQIIANDSFIYNKRETFLNFNNVFLLSIFPLLSLLLFYSQALGPIFPFIFGLIGIVLIICVVIEQIENKQNNNKFEKEYYDVNNLILNKIEKNHFTICCLRDLINDLKKHEFIYEKYDLKEEIIYNSEISIKEFKKLLKEKIRLKQNHRLESLNLK